MTFEQIAHELEKLGVGMTESLGFNNTYALVMRRDRAEQLGTRTITDLRSHGDLRFGLTHEFLDRNDGWRRLAAEYGLNASTNVGETFSHKLWRWTARHLELAGLSLLLSILVGLPLGILASRGGLIGQFIIGFAGIVQTIPSLALLALLVPLPFFGISVRTAIFALFLYGLLPIVRNTAAGLQDLPQSLRDSATALGLEASARLRKIYLPMASRSILAGIKTSAVINVGTATLAALIGAGGLGEPILSGLNLNDHVTILEGAIPAAVLALLVQWCFDLLDHVLIPKGLRL